MKKIIVTMLMLSIVFTSCILVNAEAETSNEVKFQSVAIQNDGILAVATDGGLYGWGSVLRESIPDDSYFDMNKNNTQMENSVRLLDNIYKADLYQSKVMGALTYDRKLFIWGYDWHNEKYLEPKSSDLNATDFSFSGGPELWYSNTNGDVYEDSPFYLYDTGSEKLGGKRVGIENIICISSTKAERERSHSAISSDGVLYTWGDNSCGQLGIGNLEQQLDYEHQKIDGLGEISSVSMGSWHVGALTKDGVLYTWGCNSYGALGIGNSIPIDGEYKSRCTGTPQRVMDNVVKISMGTYIGAAITTDGSLYTWGDNYNRQIGDGTNDDNRITPVKIMDNVIDVYAGNGCMAAVKSDGSLYVWGKIFRKYYLSPTKVTVYDESYSADVHPKFVDNENKMSDTEARDIDSNKDVDDTEVKNIPENVYSSINSDFYSTNNDKKTVVSYYSSPANTTTTTTTTVRSTPKNNNMKIYIIIGIVVLISLIGIVSAKKKN